MASALPVLSAIGTIVGAASSLSSLFGGAPKAPPAVQPPAAPAQAPSAPAAHPASAPVAAAADTQKRAAAALATQSGTVGAGGPQGLQQTSTKEKATLLG